MLGVYRKAGARGLTGHKLDTHKRNAVDAVKRERRAIANQRSTMDQRDLLKEWINKIEQFMCSSETFNSMKSLEATLKDINVDFSQLDEVLDNVDQRMKMLEEFEEVVFDGIRMQDASEFLNVSDEDLESELNRLSLPATVARTDKHDAGSSKNEFTNFEHARENSPDHFSDTKPLIGEKIAKNPGRVKNQPVIL